MNNKKNAAYLSASELVGLPGMPTSIFGLLKRAARETWPSRTRAGRGGGREFSIESLPAETQAAIAQLHLGASRMHLGLKHPHLGEVGPDVCEARTATSGAERRAETLAANFESRSESLKAEARERLAILQEYHQLRARGFGRAAVTDAVTRERHISSATLSRYLGLVHGEPEHLWLYALCPAYAGRTATAAMSAEAWEVLKADYLRPERPSASACITRLRKAARERGWSVPSNRTLLRRLEALPRVVKVMRREGMAAAKALYPAQQRSKAALVALQIVNGDGYKHNVWVRFPDGEVVRAKTWYWQDVYSSKILAWRTDKTEHTDMIRLAFGDLVETYGIPEAAVIDNTLAAANKTMSGGVKHRFRFKVREEEPDGVFKLLGVAVHWATPRHGQAKPVERAFGIGGVGEYIDKAPELSGAWTGSNTLDKPEYDGKTRAIELAELQAVIAREIAAYNAKPGRRGAMQQGRSFDEVFNDSYTTATIRRATEAQRRLWLLATEPVRANSRDGAIALDAGRVVGERLANRYWNPELVEYAGRQVVARFDPQRLHQGAHIYTLDGRYLCFAECDRPAAFNDANAGRERNRARNNYLRASKQIAAAEVRMSTLDAAKTLAAPTSGGAADTSIPAPRVVHAIFADPLERPRMEPRPLDAETRAYMEQLEADAAQPVAVNVHELIRDTDKHRYWQSLDTRQAAGAALSDPEEQFWRHWQESPHFRIQRQLDAEFEERMAARG